MPKNIILFSDGTGNSAAKIWKTNVWRTYQALDLSDGSQIARYDDGVGTSSFKIFAVVGGAFGYGLKRNVLSLYRFLCRNYEPGDRIYAFGFSRGAFTIRILFGLVLRIGLVKSNGNEGELRRNARAAYRAYRSAPLEDSNYFGRFRTVHGLESFLRIFSKAIVRARNSLFGYENFEILKPTKIDKVRFIGLWDAVDAYGLPLEELTRAVDYWFWPMSLPDYELSQKVERACHALSLDDERTTFHPVLWTELRRSGETATPERVFPGKTRDGKKAISRVDEERISQVWFAGVHADLGGGYPDDMLAHVPLDWMMGEAEKAGLVFNKPERLAVRAASKKRPTDYERNARITLAGGADRNAPRHNSRKGFASYYRYGPRKIELLTNDTTDSSAPIIVPWPKIHETALERVRSGTDGYAPIGLPARYAVVAASGRIAAAQQPGLPSTVAANLYEHTTQSASRANVQETIWNFVWWKRKAYYFTVAATTYLVAFPLIHSREPAWLLKVLEYLFGRMLCAIDWAFGGAIRPIYAALTVGLGSIEEWLSPLASIAGKIVSTAVTLLRAVVPGDYYLRPWYESYAAHPGWFLFGLALVALGIWAGSSLQGKIFFRMRMIWAPIMKAGPKKVPVQRLPSDWLYQFRSSALYVTAIEWLRWKILPTFFAALIAYLIFMAVWRCGDILQVLQEALG